MWCHEPAMQKRVTETVGAQTAQLGGHQILSYTVKLLSVWIYLGNFHVYQIIAKLKGHEIICNPPTGQPLMQAWVNSTIDM
jgi:hypothetical protein